MWFLLLELILADQLADLPFLLVVSSGQEWQYEISTVRAHIGRSTGRSSPPVVSSSGQEWQYDISTVRYGNGTFLLLEPILTDYC